MSYITVILCLNIITEKYYQLSLFVKAFHIIHRTVKDCLVICCR